jgi:hypothetical protein
MFRSIDQARSQSISLNVSADDEKMDVILDWEALIALLINMAHSAGVVVSMIPHRVRPAHPAHEPTHLAIDQRTQHKMIVVRHQLKCIEFNLMDLKSFIENPFESFVIGVFVKNGRSKVTAIKRVVQSASFISARWSRHRFGSPKCKTTLYNMAGGNQRGLTPLISPCTLRIRQFHSEKSSELAD